MRTVIILTQMDQRTKEEAAYCVNAIKLLNPVNRVRSKFIQCRKGTEKNQRSGDQRKTGQGKEAIRQGAQERQTDGEQGQSLNTDGTH